MVQALVPCGSGSGAELEQDEDGGCHGQGRHEQRLHDVGPRDVWEQHAAVLYSRRAADGPEPQRQEVAGVILVERHT